MNKKIKEAVKTLNNGGIIIFPTDTAFGIGCRIDNPLAIKRLIKIRGRKENQPFPVLVESLEMARKYLQPIPSEVNRMLVKKYWPGSLTIVLPCRKNIISSIIRGDKDTLGVRMPDDNTVLELIKAVGVPIIGCSANFSEEKTPFLQTEINPKLIKLVDFVLDGRTKKKQPSTVIDCSKKPWTILRQGATKVKYVKKIELSIDTASNKYILVGLKINNKYYSKKQEINFQKAQVVLPMIEEILHEHKLSFNDLTSIKVNKGPGSYTGLRVGIAVANALSYFLKIPINKTQGELIEPTYE